MKSTHSYSVRDLLVILCLVFSFQGFSQFTYLSAGGGFSGLSVNSSFGNSSTYIRSFDAGFNVLFRVKQRIGIGLTFNYPVSQNSDFEFSDLRTYGDGQSSFNEYSVSTSSTRYRANQYEYNLGKSAVGSVYTRFYGDLKVNSYIDFRLSFLSISENFVFKRDEDFGDGNSPYLEEVDVDFDDSRFMASPGFRIGLQPHITKSLFLDFNLGWNFLIFSNNSFSYIIPYSENISTGGSWNQQNTHYSADFRSQLEGVKGMFQITLKVGYFF